MEIEIPDKLYDEWVYSRQYTNLPRDLVLFCWHLGISGKRIYIPSREDRIKFLTNKLICEIERVYMEDGFTFILERNARSLFSYRFSVRKVQNAYHIASKTALEITRRAYKRWSYWFKNKEEPILYKIQDKASESGIGYSALSFCYKNIRQRLRSGEPVSAEDFKLIPARAVEDLTELAKESIGSCNWDMSQRKELPGNLPDEDTDEDTPEELPGDLIEEATTDEAIDSSGQIALDNAVLWDPGLSFAEKAVFSILRSFSGRSKSCYGLVDNLVLASGVNTEYIIKILRSLGKKGLISIKRAGPGQPSLYLIHPERRYGSTATNEANRENKHIFFPIED